MWLLEYQEELSAIFLRLSFLFKYQIFGCLKDSTGKLPISKLDYTYLKEFLLGETHCGDKSKCISWGGHRKVKYINELLRVGK